jgi:hypothetical protein
MKLLGAEADARRVVNLTVDPVAYHLGLAAPRWAGNAAFFSADEEA